MNSTSQIDRPVPVDAAPSRVRTVEGIHRSTTFHWVGNGFYVSTYFPRGEPINEPIVQYGPFVMNTVEEIEQAMIDVNRGKFGPVPA
jgi:hypothetical protein